MMLIFMMMSCTMLYLLISIASQFTHLRTTKTIQAQANPLKTETHPTQHKLPHRAESRAFSRRQLY